MRKTLVAIFTAAAVVLTTVAAQAQQTIKIGLICPYSGQFADAAAQMDNGIKLYVKEHGDTVAGKKLEFIRKDTGGIAPDVAKRLAQELIVRDKVDMLACFATTPNTLAIADVSAQAKKFMVNMNAATSIITTNRPIWCGPRSPCRCSTRRSAPGPTRAASAPLTRWSPTSDRATTAKPRSRRASRTPAARSSARCASRWRTRTSLPSCSAPRTSPPMRSTSGRQAARQPAAIGKAIAERAIDRSKTKILSQGELTFDEALKSMGDTGLGIITAFHYDANHQSAKNKAFVAAYNAEYKRNPDMFSVGAYDGMHVIYEALKKTNGDTDGEKLIAAAKGMAWESPRGPMSIDPETRDVIETVYIRRVEAVNGQLVNVEFDKIENVKDPIKARMPK